MLDFQLSPQQLKLQKKARKFALKEILPVAWYYDEIDKTPLADMFTMQRSRPRNVRIAFSPSRPSRRFPD